MVLILVVVAAAVVLLLVLGDGNTPPEATDALSTDQPASAADQEGPTLKTSEAGPDRIAGGPTPSEGGAAPSAPPRHRIVGRVLGLAPAEAPAAAVTVHGLGRYDWIDTDAASASGSIEPDGRLAVDVSALRATHPSAAGVEVRIDHPAYAIARAKVELAPRRESVTRLPAPMTMQRALVISGHVVDGDGDALAGAHVLLLARRGPSLVVDAFGDAQRLDEVTTKAGGDFRLRTPDEGDVLVVAWAEGRPVVGRRLRVSRDEPIEGQVLSLGLGSRLTGQARLHGQALDGATVSAGPKIEGPSTIIPGAPAVWANGRVMAASREAKTGPDGWFEINGLEAGLHRLQVVAIKSPVLAHGAGRSSMQEVLAPALGINLNFEPASLDLQVLSGTTPVEHARVRIANQGVPFTLQTDERGRVLVLLPTATLFTLTVSHAHYAPVQRELKAADRGTAWHEIVDLGARAPLATLTVHLVDRTGKPVPRAGFHLRSRGGDGLPPAFDRGQGTLESKDGLFKLEGLEPGERLLLVTPGRESDSVHGTYLLLRSPVTLIGDREVHLDLIAVPGARVQLTVLGEAGVLTDCRATLRDNAGRKVPVRYMWTTKDTASASTQGPGAAKALLDPPLALGHYELELSAPGYLPKLLSFEAVTGKVQPLQARLRKR